MPPKGAPLFVLRLPGVNMAPPLAKATPLRPRTVTIATMIAEKDDNPV
jgi:hypothetical protein